LGRVDDPWQNKIRTPPIGVPGERTAGCKYYCDRQNARTEAGWSQVPAALPSF
jgi:hypothetical protein